MSAPRRFSLEQSVDVPRSIGENLALDLGLTIQGDLIAAGADHPTRNVGCGVGAQINHDGCDVIRVSVGSHIRQARRVARQGQVVAGTTAVRHSRGRAGRDGVGGDVVATQRIRAGLGETDQPGFGRRIVGLSSRAIDTGCGAEVDQPPELLAFTPVNGGEVGRVVGALDARE